MINYLSPEAQIKCEGDRSRRGIFGIAAKVWQHGRSTEVPRPQSFTPVSEIYIYGLERTEKGTKGVQEIRKRVRSKCMVSVSLDRRCLLTFLFLNRRKLSYIHMHLSLLPALHPGALKIPRSLLKGNE